MVVVSIIFSFFKENFYIPMSSITAVLYSRFNMDFRVCFPLFWRMNVKSDRASGLQFFTTAS